MYQQYMSIKGNYVSKISDTTHLENICTPTWSTPFYLVQSEKRSTEVVEYVSPASLIMNLCHKVKFVLCNFSEHTLNRR
jgi:heat shock protein HspQ